MPEIRPRIHPHHLLLKHCIRLCKVRKIKMLCMDILSLVELHKNNVQLACCHLIMHMVSGAAFAIEKIAKISMRHSIPGMISAK